jgi:hypothetical protein
MDRHMVTNRRRGMVLVFSIMLIAGLLMLTAVGLGRTAVEVSAARRFSMKQQAFYLAEGAVDQAVAQLAAGQSVTPSTTMATGATTVLIESLSGGLQRVTGTGAAPDFASPQSQQAVSVVIPAPPSVFQWALFGDESIDVASQANVNGDMRTNSTAAAAVKIWPQANVDSDIYVGPGGNPNSVVWEFMANRTGSNYAATEAFPMPPITVPSGDPCGSPLTVNSGTVVVDLSDPVSSCYSSFDVGGSGRVRVIGDGQIVLTGMNLASGSEVKVEGNATLVTKGIVSGYQGDIKLSEDASLKLYVTEKLELGFQSSSGIKDATKLAIFYSGTEEIKLGIQSSFKGAIYAPNATFQPSPQATFRGSVVAKRLFLQPQANIKYDEALEGWEGGMIGSTADVRDVMSWSQP